MMTLIKKQFGSLTSLEEKLIEAGTKHFGSGYVWLIYENSKLVIKSAKNAWCPIKNKGIPVLTIDIWEHSYYIDYRNDKKKHLKNIVNILNWKFASKQLK